MSVAPRLVGPLGLGDAHLLDRLASDVFDEPVAPDRLRAYLAEPGHLLILALDGDLVVGQCAAVLHRHPDKPTELYVDEVGVSPGWQRRGIARALMEAMFAEGRRQGCEEAWLGTEPGNDPANGLYKGLGAGPEAVNLYAYDL